LALKQNHYETRSLTRSLFRLLPKREKELKLEPTHPAAAIFDDLRGQTIADILSHLKKYNIIPIQLPANCTDRLQPLDVSVNKPMKDHIKSQFQQQYAQEVTKQLY